MKISIHIPADIAETLKLHESDLSQSAMEALAIEGYRNNRLSECQIARMLGLQGRLQVHAFLKQNQVPLNYSLADLEQDIQLLDAADRTLSA